MRRPAANPLGQASGGDQDERGGEVGMPKGGVEGDITAHRDADHRRLRHVERLGDAHHEVGHRLRPAERLNIAGAAEPRQVDGDHAAVRAERGDAAEPGDAGIVGAAAVNEHGRGSSAARRSADQHPHPPLGEGDEPLLGAWRDQVAHGDPSQLPGCVGSVLIPRCSPSFRARRVPVER